MANIQTLLFDAKLQREVLFTGSVDSNGEFVFKSTESETFLKFPASTKPEQFAELAEKNKHDNLGQVTVEAQESMLEALIVGKDGPVEEDVPFE